MKLKKMNRSDGFTLLELIIAMALFSILALVISTVMLLTMKSDNANLTRTHVAKNVDADYKRGVDSLHTDGPNPPYGVSANKTGTNVCKIKSDVNMFNGATTIDLHDELVYDIHYPSGTPGLLPVATLNYKPPVVTAISLREVTVSGYTIDNLAAGITAAELIGATTVTEGASEKIVKGDGSESYPIAEADPTDTLDTDATYKLVVYYPAGFAAKATYSLQFAAP